MENEFEGVEMARRAKQRKEERKTQKECRHRNMEAKHYERYT